MKTSEVSDEDLCGVFAVPPLARRDDAARTLDYEQNERIARHIVAGGITRLLYGGNAFLYHVTAPEYDWLLGWLGDLPDHVWAIPSVGPSFGRAMDQARLLAGRRFSTAMLLPCGDPRDAGGLERGIRDLAEAAGVPLIVYLKDEDNFGRDRSAGLGAVARLVSAGVVCAIKYAVVRPDPSNDPYLDALLERVDRGRVISGMGERPAVVHLRDRRLPGFTTGSGSVAPGLSQALFVAASTGDWVAAERLRSEFMPLEDVRDRLGPARVLHAAVDAAGIAVTGPIPPFVSDVTGEDRASIRSAALALSEAETLFHTGARA
jgi:dihydrodipicolinate synthase/N-acetylneuraminate lyase